MSTYLGLGGYKAKHGGKGKVICWERGGRRDDVEVMTRGKFGELVREGIFIIYGWVSVEIHWAAELLSFFCTSLQMLQRNGREWPLQGQLLHSILIERRLPAHLVRLQRSGRQFLLSRCLSCSWGTNIHTYKSDISWSCFLRTGKGKFQRHLSYDACWHLFHREMEGCLFSAHPGQHT